MYFIWIIIIFTPLCFIIAFISFMVGYIYGLKVITDRYLSIKKDLNTETINDDKSIKEYNEMGN